MASVLVVDDNHLVRSLLRDALRDEGYVAEVAGDGAEALVLMRKTPFDVLITDQHMPVMDGAALIRTVRSGEAGVSKELPILALAGSKDAELKTMSAGADFFLAKPFKYDALFQALEGIMKKGLEG